jgi:RimJ/RimL family protein N-acetyltransferase
MSWDRARDARLEDDRVLLRRLSADDRDALRAIAFDEEIWRYFVFRIERDEDLERFIADAVNDTAAGRRVAFAVVDKVSGRLAGSMAFGNMVEAEKRLEIGWSWLGRPYRGTGVNAAAKRLMLQYAFDELGCERVEFKTDVLNRQARKGLLNIGAKEEGVLRSYNFMPDNRRRDVVYYSILRQEWPAAERALRARLETLSAYRTA